MTDYNAKQAAEEYLGFEGGPDDYRDLAALLTRAYQAGERKLPVRIKKLEAERDAALREAMKWQRRQQKMYDRCNAEAARAVKAEDALDVSRATRLNEKRAAQGHLDAIRVLNAEAARAAKADADGI